MHKKILCEPQQLRLGILTARKRLLGLMGAGALLLSSLSAQAQLSGAKSIPGDYATVAAAVTALNAQGVGSGGVTFNIAPGYTETVANVLITASGTAANPIAFQKGTGTGANPLFTGGTGVSTTLDSFFTLQGADYVTFDGLSLVDPAANATTTTQIEWGFALLKTSTPAVDGCQNVVIRNCAITLQKGTATSGIYSANHTPASTSTLTPTTLAGTNSNNKFYGNTISRVNNGIYVAGFAAASPYLYYDQGNEIGSVLSGTTATGNTITDYGTTTTAYGIYSIYQHGVKVQGNTVTSTTATTTTGPTSTLYGILVTTGGSADLLGNTVTVNTNTTTSTSYGIQNGSGANGLNGAATTVNMGNNSLSMNSTTTTTGVFYGVYNTSTPNNLNMFANTISNWNRTGTSAFNYLLYVSSSPTATLNVYNNTISDVTTTGATSGIYCIYGFPGTAATQYYGNTVQNITCDGNSLYGIYLSGGPTVDVYRNRVSGLTANGTTATIYGIYTTGTTTTLTNNLMGDFKAPAASNTNALTGLYLAGGTTVNAQYNSIYLNGSSSGANFGTSGIYFTSTATTLVTLRNNVVVNTSTAAGTGSTVALRRSTGTVGVAPTNLTTATNNNLYYAGAPATTGNLIYAEGTGTLTNGLSALADYKAFLTDREGNSVTENVPFVSTAGTNANFLKVSTTTPTQVEGGGVAIAGITTDYANATRSATAPDLGAYEGTYQPLDLTGPAILNATLSNTNSTANRTLVVTISDAAGVATGANAPRLYYRKGTSGAYVFVNATSVSGNQYTFTLNYALLPGGTVATGDVIQYYVAAQDLAATPNVSTAPNGGSGATPPGTTAPATPGSYQIVTVLSGIYYVGTSTPPAGTPADRVYPTLTAAANAYNLNVLSGAVTFYLLDATYSTAETFPIVFNANASASATNTVRISPYTGVTSTITGAANSLLQFKATTYLTFDGSNVVGGTQRNLTLNNTQTTASGVVIVGSQGLGNGTSFLALRNLNLRGASNGNSSSFGILVSATPTGTPATGTGADNDNLTIQNNAISGVYYGIYAGGTTAVSAGGLDGLTISNNLIGPATAAAADNIGNTGLYLTNAVNPVVSGNTVRNVTASTATYGMNFPAGVNGATVSQNTISGVSTSSTNAYGIYLGTNFINGVVDRNRIENVVGAPTGGYGGKGIDIATGNATSNLVVSNNLISGMNGSGWSTLTSDAIIGIRVASGSGITVAYNSVNLYGSYLAASTSAYLSAALFVNTGSTNLTVANNVLVNTLTNTGGTASVAYSFYTYAPASAYTVLNSNDYYVAGAQGVLANVGGSGGVSATTAVATLAALQTATGKDASSVSADPIFASNTDLKSSQPALNNVGTPVAGITTDFTGAARSATTPDIGAYEFTPQPIDIAASALVSPVNSGTSTCFGAGTPVTVQVRNNGTATLNFATNPLTVTVVITGPTGTTPQTLTQVINTGTLASTATQNITLTSLANFTTLGTYSFGVTTTVTGDLNTTNDVLTPAATLNVVAPVAGTLSPSTYAICVSGSTTLTLAGAANGSIQYQSSTSATGPFSDISGATSATYTTPTLTSTTYYRAVVSCGNNSATSNVSTVAVNNPVISAAPSPVSTCAGATASLSATVPSGVSVRYFTTATGGTAIGTGNPFTTPALTASTTYYAEAFAGNQENVGKPSTTGTDGTNTIGGLYFTATAPTVITNVTVYRTANAAAGTATIQLLNGSTTSGTPVASVTVPVPANTTAAISPTVLTLNLAVPAAGSYTLYLSAATPSLIRDFSSTPQPATAYPYASPSGLVTITSSTLGNDYYYFFYNWQIGSECVGGSRTPIQVNVTPGLVASLPVAAFTSCGQTPYQLNGAIAGTATGAVYTSTGTGTFSPNATTLNATYTPSAADVAAGTVTITLTPTGPAAPCTSTGRVVLTLQAAPNAAFSYPAGTYCTNSPVTVAPVLAPGAVAGTFATTGFGLRIDPVTGVINLANTNIDGTFTVTNTVAGTGACSSFTASTTFTVIFGIAQPTLTATPQAGGSVLLSTPVLAGATYQFFKGSPAVAVGPPSSSNTLLLAAGTQTGSYTVVVTATTGCSSIPSAPVSVVVTGTQTATRNGVSLLVYPNPTPNGNLTVELRGTKANASQFSVFNALGQVVRTGTLGAGLESLSLNNLSSGVYTLRVQTSEGVLTQRIVRE
ncbi:Ig-like domain-containing protein [Hymenobacter armeniacus]|uniref:T9SS type A sorting domain-containing protein n=1 Tax=Hymenobacter armeniacus TaxID=2771358 RepID=A0ABR8JS95_9BACT|nr:T9SS type A sorting domain-containing protein [Hymenobacter armeniacus]MBD2722841.1 T9SS type A sorting domain-containing protein [Hymenobacter armeniacus]